MCLVWRLPHWEPGVTGLWHPAYPQCGIPEDGDWRLLGELFDWIQDGGLVEAHNSWFERGIWTNILVPRFGFLPIPHRLWRCSAAKAATHALPRALEGCTSALGLAIEKDEAGSELMKKMCKPRKPKKADKLAWAYLHNGCTQCVKGKLPRVGRAKAQPCPTCEGKGFIGTPPPLPTLWHETKAMFERLWDYCRVDVLAEECLSESIPDLNKRETEVYLMDQAVNERGFMLDRNNIDVALALIDEEAVQLTAELRKLTKGEVEKATQRERMKKWFTSQGFVLENTQAATIDACLNSPGIGKVAYRVRRGLEIVRLLGRSSTAKYRRMKDWICPDDRVRGGLLYHGAGTGRWSGAGVQPHNFPKGKIKEDSQGEKWNMDATWDIIAEGEGETLQDLFGSVLEPLSQALRGAIIPTPGKHLFVADYASIEARVLQWLAGNEEQLALFREGGDPYCDMAGAIYGRVIDKHQDPNERQLGKVAILGLGYQMGWRKFIESAKSYGIVLDDEMSQLVVRAYRQKMWRVVNLWNDTEAAACEAAQNPGIPIDQGPVTWLMTEDKRFLYCELPSGRRLAFPFAQVKLVTTPWGDQKLGLTFKGVNPVTRQWHTQKAYGGLLVENIVQAVARDLMAEAMLRAEQSKRYEVVLSVHDELIGEADPTVGTVSEFEQLMAECPDWAEGCPVAAEGWSGVRYRK